jgi:hypothetical protein
MGTRMASASLKLAIASRGEPGLPTPEISPSRGLEAPTLKPKASIEQSALGVVCLGNQRELGAGLGGTHGGSPERVSRSA